MSTLAAPGISEGRASRWRLAAALLLLCLAALSIVLLPAIDGQQIAPWKLDRATLVLVTADNAVPGPAEEARPLRLPDSWNQTHPDFGGAARYTFEITLGTTELADRMLYVPRLSNAGQVTLNGHPLLVDAYDADRQSDRWNRPLGIEVPETDLIVGINRLAIIVSGLANGRAGLSAVYFGPRSALTSTLRYRELLQDDLPRLASLAVIVIGLPLILIWLRDPRGSANYGLFGFGAVLIALRSLHGQVGDLPIRLELWWPIVTGSLGWGLAPFFIFILRFSGYQWRRLEQAIWLFTIVGTAVLFALPSTRFMGLATWLWYTPLFAVGTLCVGAFVTRALQTLTWQRLALLLGFIAQFAAGLHDVLARHGTLPFDAVLWLPISLPLLLIGVSAVLADDMARTRASLSSMNSTLEARVAATRKELDQTYERKRAVERDMAGAEERLRLMRDMHDGVGTRLALLLSNLRRAELSTDQVSAAIQESLDDLRLIFDARSPTTTTLVDAVANFRHRLVPRLTAAGIDTGWEIADAAEEIVLPAEATLHVLRILHECFSNAVRHGRPKRIVLQMALTTLGPARRRLAISVIDDGVGTAMPGGEGSGHGLRNMRARAAALGGEFEITSDAAGTTARLTVPIGTTAAKPLPDTEGTAAP